MLSQTHILRVAPFRRLWTGQAISDLGDSLYFLVFLFMADRLSGNNTQVVGVIGAIQAIPWLLLGPYAGTVADRIDRRKIMVACTSTSAVITFGFGLYLFFVPAPPLWLIGLTGGLLSSVNAFFYPARSASIPRLVPEERLLEANGLIMTTQTVIGMGSAAFSASLLGLLAATMPDKFFSAATLINSVTFMLAAGFIFGLPVMVPERKVIELREELARRRDRLAHGVGQMFRDIAEGLRAIMGNPVMKLALPINIGVSLFISGFFPLYVKTNNVWFGGEGQVGQFDRMAWIEFSFMLPLAVMSLLMARFNIKRPGYAYSMALMGCGATIVAMGWGQNYWVYIFWNFLCGLTLPFAWIPMATYMQAAFPDEMRGRVNSVWTTMSQGIQPISLIVVGTLLTFMQLTPFYIIIGLAMVIFAGLGLLSRSYRDAAMPAFSAPVIEELDDQALPA